MTEIIYFITQDIYEREFSHNHIQASSGSSGRGFGPIDGRGNKSETSCDSAAQVNNNNTL